MIGSTVLRKVNRGRIARHLATSEDVSPEHLSRHRPPKLDTPTSRPSALLTHAKECELVGPSSCAPGKATLNPCQKWSSPPSIKSAWPDVCPHDPTLRSRSKLSSMVGGPVEERPCRGSCELCNRGCNERRLAHCGDPGVEQHRNGRKPPAVARKGARRPLGYGVTSSNCWFSVVTELSSISTNSSASLYPPFRSRMRWAPVASFSVAGVVSGFNSPST
jgi:hypothetical protein